MERTALLEQGIACLKSVEQYYLRRHVPLVVSIGITKRLVVLPVQLGKRGASKTIHRQIPAACDVLPSRRVIRLHPQLAVENAPRYVVLALLYWSSNGYMQQLAEMSPARSDGDERLLAAKVPPGAERADAWLMRHGFPPAHL